LKAAKPALSDLEVQAAIYQVAGLPEVFKAGVVVVPAESTVEICDASAFLQPPLPFDLRWTLLKEGAAPLSGVSTSKAWMDINIPPGYEGAALRLEASRPVVAYRLTSAEAFLMGGNRTRVLRELVAPASSGRRLRLLSREGIRKEELPSDPRAIAADPRTAEAWQAFLAKASDRR
jgi:hypothetical protein